MDYFNDARTTFLGLDRGPLLSIEGQKALVIHQKYLNLCFEDERSAFTPDANEALRANDLHVKSMQRRDRQSCGAIRANEAARIERLGRLMRYSREYR